MILCGLCLLPVYFRNVTHEVLKALKNFHSPGELRLSETEISKDTRVLQIPRHGKRKLLQT
jgi:hypothetical protein